MHFDIILSHVYSRINTYNINILKALSDKYRIGVIIIQPSDASHKAKQKKYNDADKIYLENCITLGGTILDDSNSYTCELFLIAQYSFEYENIKLINYKKILLIASTAAYGGYILKEYKEIGGSKICVFFKDIFENVTNDNNEQSALKGIEIIECEPPYSKYPAIDFSHLEIDYIIAYPTHLFTRDISKYLKLLENVYQLLKKIPNESNIFFKRHSFFGHMEGKQNYSNKKNKTYIYNFLRYILSFYWKLITFDKNVSIRETLMKIQIITYLRILERRATDLADVTKFHNYNIEHFLPFVKKGIITGISTCILNALNDKLPVYNCDDQKFDIDSPNYNHIKNYYIPPCNGDLNFNELHYNKINRNSIKNDNSTSSLLDIINKEMIR